RHTRAAAHPRAPRESADERRDHVPGERPVPVMGSRPPAAGNLKERLEAYERSLILAALEESEGNQRRAARALGVSPTSLNEKLKRLRIGVKRTLVDLGRASASGGRRG